MSALTPTSLPAPPITRTCRQRPYSRPAPSAQPVEPPAPRPRSGIASLPAHCLWSELTVATCSSRSSFVHTAPGYLCPSWHSQAVKQLWFGQTLTQYLVSKHWCCTKGEQKCLYWLLTFFHVQFPVLNLLWITKLDQHKILKGHMILSIAVLSWFMSFKFLVVWNILSCSSLVFVRKTRFCC